MAEFDPLFGALPNDEWFPSPAHVMRRAIILDIFEVLPPGRLLEMGCGAGRMLADWGRLGHFGQAVDLDPTARALAERCTKVFSLDFKVNDRPDGDEVFDYLVATEVLEHVEDPSAVLKDWLGWLKEGGILLATVPAFQHYWSRSDEWAGHVQRFEPDQFRKLIEAVGLEVLEQRLYGYPLGNLIRMAGNITSAMKMRIRMDNNLDRQGATFASGHDRSIEKRLSPLMRSLPGRLTLKLASSLQRRYPSRGHGMVLLARKPASVVV